MVKRVDVLKRAREYFVGGCSHGLCYAIQTALSDYTHQVVIHLWKVFPLFTCETAYKYGFNPHYDTVNEKYSDCGFWWNLHDHHRLDFLEWLIEQYKDDEEDLLEMKLFNKNKQ